MDSSRGVPTVIAIVWASAPGYEAKTRICGGAMLGYCLTGSWRAHNAPEIIKIKAITMAKRGRRIKNFENMLCVSLILYINFCAVGEHLRAVLNDEFPGLHAVNSRFAARNAESLYAPYMSSITLNDIDITSVNVSKN